LLEAGSGRILILVGLTVLGDQRRAKGKGRLEVVIMMRETHRRCVPGGEAKRVSAKTSGGRLRRDVLLLAVAAMGGAIGCSGPSDRSDVEQVGRVEQAYTKQYFGVEGVYRYWDGSHLDFANDALNGFYNQMIATDYSAFKYISDDSTSYPGRAPYWRETERDAWSSPQKGLDRANLFFHASHTGVDLGTPTSVGWTMYEWPSPDPWVHQVNSNNMRLGDDGRRLSFFSSMGCGTLYFDDGRAFERWGPIIAGGLKMGLGAYCLLWGGYEMWPIGPSFAYYLQSGLPVWGAWYWAFAVVNDEMPIAAIATGASENDCWNRLYNMTWLNHTNGSYPRLQDAQIQFGCLSYNDTFSGECGIP
jgi:hypothetical protein